MPQNETPKIFLSYSWQNKDESSTIEKDFNKIGIPLIKDTKNIRYKDSISNFIKNIRNSDFAILLISDDYLKSVNCMSEAIEILKEQNHNEKILPILINKPKIFKTADRIKYVKYWQEEKMNLEYQLKGLDVTSSINSYNDLQNLEAIYSSIDEFLKKIGDMKSLTLEDLQGENYKSILDYLGFEDITYLLELFMISQIENLVIKEAILNTHINKFGISPYAIFVKAKLKSELGFQEEARKLYQESLRMDSSNSAVWNDYGYLLDTHFNKSDKAVECYKKAIKLNGNLTVSRINLAIIYSKKNKINKSKKQYLKILEIDPTDEKAHNNIANIYRSEGLHDKVIYHLETAIKYNPNYIDAYLNLGNFYDVTLFETEKANYYYNIAKKKANNKTVDMMVDYMHKFQEKRSQKQNK